MNAEGKPTVLPTSQPPLALSSALSLGAVLPDQDQRAAGSTSKNSEGPGGPAGMSPCPSSWQPWEAEHHCP